MFRRSLLMIVICLVTAPLARADAALIRSAGSGAWSTGATWEGGHVPAAGDRVQIRPGHTVSYDLAQSPVIRSIHVAGILAFATDRDTRLDVGLIKIQAGEDASENGFDCGPHPVVAAADRPALLVGTEDRPVDVGHTAVIRLTYIKGMDEASFPALICCGGRMEFHGTPMNRTWVKLGATLPEGATDVALAEPVTGWRVGDRVIVTASERQSKLRKTFMASVKHRARTEERVIAAVVDGQHLKLDKPVEFGHAGEGNYRAEIANLSRNAVVESADPDGPRGHTMFHHGSAGSIGYAEFRHLGKEGQLGRYSLHFHLAGDSMRGTSVVGASIWDSGNRWITIHGTNYLVVRDCVGYFSVGHGFFLEDGTEVNNLLDRNLAVQACAAPALKDQVFAFDQNDGSGFWWANSENAFTRNVAVECDEYAYFFQAPATHAADLKLQVRRPDGTRKATDIRTLPFIRFDGNEAHSQRRHALNLGGGVPFGPGVGGVGPDAKHPFILRNTKLWDVHWAIHPVSPALLVENMEIDHADYGIWRPVYTNHAYKNVTMTNIAVKDEFMPVGQKPNPSDFPNSVKAVDDQPPVTVITSVKREGTKLMVRGTCVDNGEVRRVIVNGVEATATAANYLDWTATLDALAGELKLTAQAEDAAGNGEKTPHVMEVTSKQ